MLITFDKKPTLNTRGELVADAKIARAGIYQYLGKELGFNDERSNKMYNIYRRPEVVMDKRNLASFAGITITDDHPDTLIDTANWREHAVGETGNDILRDGDNIVVPIVIRHQPTIDKITKDNKVGLSAGYKTLVDMTAGTTPDGQPFDGTQEFMEGNHLALVDEGRAGKECCIAMDKKPDGKMLLTFGFAQDKTLKTDTPEGEGDKPNPQSVKDTPMTIQLIPCIMGDSQVNLPADYGMAVKTAFDKEVNSLDIKHKQALKDAAETATKALDETKAELKTATDKVTELEAKLTDGAIDKRVEARASVLDSAKKMGFTGATDGKSDVDIMRDALKLIKPEANFTDMEDNSVIGAFAWAATTAKDGGTALNVGDSGDNGGYMSMMDRIGGASTKSADKGGAK